MMPSWNIHTAHVQALFSHDSPSDLGVYDLNAFMLGNLVPDIYVGHIVPDVTKRIAYKYTHLVDTSYIPLPNAALFYENYLVDGRTSDIVVGAWTHLICDHYYNLRTTEFIAGIGVKPSDQTRRRKQADFDMFGRTMSISWVPVANEKLLSQCASFPQYEIFESDVYATIGAQKRIVCRNLNEHLDDIPSYCLFTPEYLVQTFDMVDSLLREALRLRASGVAPLELGRA